jgi:hypothetical protein
VLAAAIMTLSAFGDRERRTSEERSIVQSQLIGSRDFHMPSAPIHITCVEL